MAKRGRPTKYKKKYCEEVIELSKQGYFDSMIYAEWGISKETYYAWKREHPEFKEAADVAIHHFESFMWKQHLEGKIPFKTFIAAMNAKCDWNGTSTKQSKTGDTVNIGHMNVLSSSDKDVNKRLEYLMEKHGYNLPSSGETGNIIEHDAEE